MQKTDIYTNGAYLAMNPGWNAEGSAYKVEWIQSLLSRNKLDVKEIVEVGCGAGQILAGLRKLYPEIEKISGYDISPQAIEIAMKSNQPGIDFFQKDFLKEDVQMHDLVLVIDVLEHVENFYSFLVELKKRGTHFVFHIPLDLSCRSLLKSHVMLHQRETAGHIHYFSRDMVWWFLKDAGYEVIDWRYTKPVGDIEKSTGFKSGIKKLLRKISFSISKNKSVDLWGDYSLMILAK